MHNLHDLVVHWGGDAYLAAEGAYHTVYGIDFGLLAFLEVLQHTCLEQGVLAYGYGDDEE